LSDKFKEEDWAVDLYLEAGEAAVLNAAFPQEFEVEDIDSEPSEIDGEYHEVAWTTDRPGLPKEQAGGMFIAFMPKTVYQQAFGSIGEPPDEYAEMCARLIVEKRDEPQDQKSHPNWKCWLEVTEATFLRWQVDQDDDENDDEDVVLDQIEISHELGDPDESIAQKLENLLAAFEAKGADGIRKSMQAALTREEIERRTSWFPASLPQSVIELYEWANGQASDPWNEPYPFVFRDMGFLSLENAATEYESMMSSYGVDNTLEDDGIELATSFPIAAFNGGWYVVPVAKHTLDTDNPQPVVCVLEGIDMQFHSIPKMLDTCNEWVRASSYDYEDGELNEREEMAIWLKHNPGIDGDE